MTEKDLHIGMELTWSYNTNLWYSITEIKDDRLWVFGSNLHAPVGYPINIILSDIASGGVIYRNKINPDLPIEVPVKSKTRFELIND